MLCIIEQIRKDQKRELFQPSNFNEKGGKKFPTLLSTTVFPCVWVRRRVKEPKCVQAKAGYTPVRVHIPHHRTLYEHIGDRNLAHGHPGPV